LRLDDFGSGRRLFFTPGRHPGRPQADPGSHFMPSQCFYAYILASKPGGTIYIGVTNNLVRRVWEHKQDLSEGFTKRYRVHDLVYFEQHDAIEQAILREKKIKRWQRDWKVKLIEEGNPTWRDLYGEIAAP
jgi:putative endonuclease